MQTEKRVMQLCGEAPIIYDAPIDLEPLPPPKLTNREKRVAVLRYWHDDIDRVSRSNVQVAAATGTSHTFVGNLRRRIIAQDNLYQLRTESGLHHDSMDTIRDRLLEITQTPATLQPAKTYVSMGSVSENPIPRHQTVTGVTSLANLGYIVLKDGQLMPETDAIELPYPIGTLIEPIDEPHITLKIEEYRLVGTDAWVFGRSDNGYSYSYNLQEIVKKTGRKSLMVAIQNENRGSDWNSLPLDEYSDDRLLALRDEIDSEIALRQNLANGAVTQIVEPS